MMCCILIMGCGSCTEPCVPCKHGHPQTFVPPQHHAQAEEGGSPQGAASHANAPNLECQDPQTHMSIMHTGWGHISPWVTHLPMGNTSPHG